MEMRDKIAYRWYIMVINIVINFAILLFPIPREIKEASKIDIQKIEEKEQVLEVNTIFPKPSFSLTINNQQRKIDEISTSNLKMSKLGKYYVLYKFKINKYREIDRYQQVEVVDKEKPSIFLNNGETEEIAQGSIYQNTYIAIDNYDGDITEKVKVKGKVDTKKEGTYTLTYQVEDSSSNQTEVQKKVVVKAKEIEASPILYTYAVTDMDFYEKGIKLKGTIPKSKDTYELKVGKKAIPISQHDTFYEGKIDVTKWKNGIYEIKLKGKKEKDIPCKIDSKDRLQRAHIGNKLITIVYTKKDTIKIKIESFSYQYDIVIDPGHGGEDEGAYENGYLEKNVNLEQSLYEKKRFEEHGLKVKMIREEDTYGEMMGEETWHRVTRRAFAVGHYGSVAKITYSNHHNVSTNKNLMGWEILVPASLTYNDLNKEHQIIEKWNEIYTMKENHIRMYARDYDTGNIYNKINGQIYNMKNYYAVNRIPYKSYFVKVPIFEGSYISNQEDFTWYWQNYKKLSEQKIKIYVESLGISYKKPKEEV